MMNHNSKRGMKNNPHTGADLYREVRAAFVLCGTTLNRWCVEHGICRVYATKCLRGERNGPKAIELRTRILEETQPNRGAICNH